MPSLLAALSPDESRVAALIPTPGTSIRVQILQSTTSTLQTTLLHRRKESALEVLPEKIFFLSDSLVVTFSLDLIVVWDLNRGVVASTIEPKKENQFVDVAPSDGKLYALVWSKETNKAQIHCFKAETGKMEQKIKAGKGAVVALAVTGTTAIVRHEDSIRILDVTNGHKIAKYSPLKTISNALFAGGDLVVTLENGEALVLHHATGKRVFSVPCDSDQDTLDLWKHQQDDGFTLRVGSKVYKVSKDGTDIVMQCHIRASSSADERILLLGKSVYALLLQGGQFQVARSAIKEKEISLDWKLPESTETHSTNKRKKDAAVVLGPASEGGEARGILDGPQTKRQRPDQIDPTTDEEMEEKEGLSTEEDEGPTVASRLQKLQEALDEDEDDEDEEDQVAKVNDGFQVKTATTESLTELLNQALQSSDDGMLELALSVRDNRILQESCSNLSEEHLPVLLNALTARLASKPTRAGQLCPWVSALLKTGRIRSIAHLQPLRNLLQERLEVFPALLKLEGRLGMMTNL